MVQRVGATLALAVLAPVLVLVGASIRVSDGGPVLFRQSRQGIGRRPFTILKFRTMRDGEVTGVGRVLRRTGLDELPQLVNVARGDMSFIGPRPLTDADVARLSWGSPAHDARWLVAPGITGWAQLAPVCDREVSWALDEEYARRRCVRLDLKIILASVLALVRGKQRAKEWLWR